MIDQSVWRAGLPEPDYERVVHEVHNIIIHHSAGSNTDTNYISVVRNIYIFHTQAPDAGRGWSDIGYNYLIAQDGTIFKGRDPDIFEQDNIKGAHFCGANTGTMGICVLGNYMDVEPPGEAVLSLNELLTWKTGKDSLDPVGIYPHTLNSGLFVISGHRDGCATLCPGDNLYDQLAEIRSEVMTEFTACGYIVNPVVSLRKIESDEPNVYLRDDILILDCIGTTPEIICVTDIIGKRYPVNYDILDEGKLQMDFSDQPGGVYLIHIIAEEKQHVLKIILLK